MTAARSRTSLLGQARWNAAPILAGWLLLTAGGAGSGCAGPQVPPATLTAQTGADAFAARSLHSPELQQYLRANLGHAPEAWEFETLCWVGFYYQPSLEVARAQWDAARAAQQTAAARPNPSLTLTPGYDFTHQAGVSPWMPSVGADLLLPTGSKRARQREMAGADADAARLAIATAAWQLRADLRKALLEAHGAVRRAALQREQANIQQRLFALLEQRFQLGGVAATEVSLARTAVLRADANAASAESQAATARTRVATVLGLPATALEGIELPLPPQPTTLSAADLVTARSRALRSRADVVGALAKYRSADLALQLELAKRYPDVHLGPAYQYDQGLNKWSLGLTFELPVFNQNQGPIAEAIAHRAETAAQFNAVQNQAVGAIDTATAALKAASSQLDHARQLRVEVRRQAELARRQQQLGGADQVAVESAALDVATTDAAVADAENAAAAAAGDLEDALQIPFPNLEALVR